MKNFSFTEQEIYQLRVCLREYLAVFTARGVKIDYLSNVVSLLEKFSVE